MTYKSQRLLETFVVQSSLKAKLDRFDEKYYNFGFLMFGVIFGWFKTKKYIIIRRLPIVQNMRYKNYSVVIKYERFKKFIVE